MQPIRRQTVVITGGARGLGLIFARRYAARGANVAICSRTAEDLARAENDLRRRFPKIGVLARVCDASDAGQVDGFVKSVIDEFGEIDILINDASIIQVGPFETINRSDFRRALGSNLWSMINFCQRVAPRMARREKRGVRGRILNITSIGGVIPVPHLLPYVASKFGAFGFSATLGAELSRYRVSVTTAVPGLMRTGSYRHAFVKGKKASELAWFAAGASTPVLSMSAERAAVKMMRACERGKPVCVVGAPAKVARLAFALFPNLTLRVLGWVNRLLPASPQRLSSISSKQVAEKGYIYEPVAPLRSARGLGRRAAFNLNERRRVG